MMKKKVFSMLALLLVAAAGAWAQNESNTVTVTPAGNETNKWTFQMPASNVVLQVEYTPSYDVTFNTEGVSDEEAAKFTVQPNTVVYEGDKVTVSYTGTKRLIGFKVEKQAASRTLSQATAADLGKIAGADGNIYDSKDAASTAGTTATGRLRRSMKASPVACPSSAVPNGTTALSFSLAFGRKCRRTQYFRPPFVTFNAQMARNSQTICNFAACNSKRKKIWQQQPQNNAQFIQ